MSSYIVDFSDYEYKKYLCTKETLKETIDKYGVGILPPVLTKEELDAMNSGMWDYLETVTSNFEIPINRNDKKTWGEFFRLLPLHSMLMQHYQIGQAQYVWNLRQNPKIVDVFATLWKCTPEDLLVSFDGASFNPPPETIKRGWRGNVSWLHTDQSFQRNDFECVQSWITGFDVDDGDATLTFLEGSNVFHEDCMKEFNISRPDDWYRLSPVEIDFYMKTKGCRQKYIKCPAGSMVFWDSRTIHAGAEPSKERRKPNLRNVVYICMMPKHMSTPRNNQMRKEAFDTMRVTNHNVCRTKIFPIVPKVRESPTICTPIKRPVLTKLGASLAGQSYPECNDKGGPVETVVQKLPRGKPMQPVIDLINDFPPLSAAVSKRK
jgi:hypothetical protein